MRFTRHNTRQFACVAVAFLSLASFAMAGKPDAQPAAEFHSEHIRLELDLKGFTGPVRSLAFSNDGAMLVASGDHVTRIWDTETGKLLRTLRGEVGNGGVGNATAVAFSQDNCELVVGVRSRKGGALRIYDVRNIAKMKERIGGLPGTVEQLAFSRDGRFLVASTGSRTLVYDWRLRRLLGSVARAGTQSVLRFATEEPFLMDRGPQGMRVLSVPGLKSLPQHRWPAPLVHWREMSGRRKVPFGGQIDLLDLRLDRDQWLGAGLGKENGRPKHWAAVWSLAAATAQVVYDRHRHRITAVALAPERDWAASADEQGEIHVWQARSGEQHLVLKSLARPIYRAAFNAATGQIGFTTTPDTNNWQRNSRGRIDRAFDLARRVIVDASPSDFTGEVTKREGNLRVTYDGQFGLGVDAPGGQTHKTKLPTGTVPTAFTLLRPRQGFAFGSVVGDLGGRVFALDPVRRVVTREFVGHRDLVTSLSESADGRLLTTSSTDGTIRIWNLDGQDPTRTGKRVEPQLSLILLGENDWIMWTPQGYYDASPGSGELLGWHVSRGPDQPADFYSLHQFRRQLYRPDLVNLVLKTGTATEAIATADRRKPQGNTLAKPQGTKPQGFNLHSAKPQVAKPEAGKPNGTVVSGMGAPGQWNFAKPFGPTPPRANFVDTPFASPAPVTTDFRRPQAIDRMAPPAVRIVSPRDGMVTKEGQVHVLAEVVSANAMAVADVRVLVNGRPAAGKAITVEAGDKQDPRRTSFSRTVNLLPGENQITVLAANQVAGSSPISVRVRYNAPETVTNAKPNLHLLAIGISKYKDQNLNLQFAHEDAKAFASAWDNQRGKVYATINKTLLMNEQATTQRIGSAMMQLASKATQRDVVVIFISAHGIRDRKLDYYLATHEVEPNNLANTGLHFSTVTRLLEVLPCKVLLFVDTCHAAGITGAKSIWRDPLYELTSSEYGAIVFSSSLSREISLEDKRWGHGAFTKAILDTFGTIRSDINGDGFLSLTEMEQSVCDRVQQMTKGGQHPVMKRPSTIHNIPFYRLGKGRLEPTLARAER